MSTAQAKSSKKYCEKNPFGLRTLLNMPEKSSARQQALIGRRVLDEYARKRRQKRQLDALEMDNFGDDPHANLSVSKAKKLPSFTDTEEKKKKKKKGTGEHFKQRFKKTFALLLEEEKQEFVEGEPNYVTACVPPSRFPERHFCSVCGLYMHSMWLSLLLREVFRDPPRHKVLKMDCLASENADLCDDVARADEFLE